MRIPTKKRKFLVKAQWRATAMHFTVEAKNELQAWHRAWGQVSRMLGGDSCERVTLVKELE